MDEETVVEETYPKAVGRGFNTSDGYRFFNEEKAKLHQARVDDLPIGEGVVEEDED